MSTIIPILHSRKLRIREGVLLKVTQLVGGGIGTEIQICLTWKANEEESIPS